MCWWTKKESHTHLETLSGGDENLLLIISSYGRDPPVQCRGSIRDLGSCRDLIQTLPVEEQPRIFGPEKDPRREVQIPKTIVSCKEIRLLNSLFDCLV